MLSFQQMLICFACAGPCWCASTTSSTCCVSRSWEFRSTPSIPSQWASLSSRPNPSTSTHGSFETWSNFSVLPACVTLILGFFPLHRRVIVRKFLSNVSEVWKKKMHRNVKKQGRLICNFTLSHRLRFTETRQQNLKNWAGDSWRVVFFPTCFL